MWLKFVSSVLVDDNSAFISGNGSVPNKWQAITWTIDDPVPWYIYASFGPDKLNGFKMATVVVKFILS